MDETLRFRLGCLLIIILAAVSPKLYKVALAVLGSSKTIVTSVEVDCSDGWILVFERVPSDGTIEITRLEGTMIAEVPPRNLFERFDPASRRVLTPTVMKIDERGVMSHNGGFQPLYEFGDRISPQDWLFPDVWAPTFGLVASVSEPGALPERGNLINPFGGPIDKRGKVPITRGKSLFVAYNQVVHGYFSEHWQPVTGRILYSLKFQPTLLGAITSHGVVVESERKKGESRRFDNEGGRNEPLGANTRGALPSKPTPLGDPSRLPGSSPPTDRPVRFGLRFTWVPPRSPTEHGFWMGETEVTWNAIRDWIEGEEYKGTDSDADIGIAMTPDERKRRGSTVLYELGFTTTWEVERLENGLEGYPAVIPVEAASQFCAAVGGRLPQAYEWQWAACGGNPSWAYPWGNTVPRDSHSCYQGCETYRVARNGSNPFGLFDMEGNASEWCFIRVQSPHFAMCGGDEKGIKPVFFIYDPQLFSSKSSGFRCVIDG